MRQPVLVLALLGLRGVSLAQTPSGAVEGQVTDPSGAAVSGAAVTVTGTNGAVKTSTTDTQGRYRVDGLAPATYTVRIVGCGFAKFDSASVDVADRIQTVNVRLQIQTERRSSVPRPRCLSESAWRHSFSCSRASRIT